MIVVSDTSPICYLLLIGEIDILPQLYGKVLIPTTVYQELLDPKSPSLVRAWLQQPPSWLRIQSVNRTSDIGLNTLDPGEQEAILLAEQKNAFLIIIDDLLGRKVATSRGLNVTGLLGVLDESARQNLINFPSAIERLQQTSFRASSALIKSLLQQHQ
jgi:predicted nucleic acid-binding protein